MTDITLAEASLRRALFADGPAEILARMKGIHADPELASWLESESGWEDFPGLVREILRVGLEADPVTVFGPCRPPSGRIVDPYRVSRVFSQEQFQPPERELILHLIEQGTAHLVAPDKAPAPHYPEQKIVDELEMKMLEEMFDDPEFPF